MARTSERQRGTSLIELTFVILMIGILSGGIATAHSLMEKATVRKLIAEMREVKEMLYVYRERYGAVPGDDYRADRHLTGAVSSYYWTRSYGYGGDGLISGPWAERFWIGMNEFAEPNLFWNHVRLAGLAPGDPLDPHVYNAVHGRLGITSGPDLPNRPAGITGQFAVCSASIDGVLARMVDAGMDDGDATTGKVWAAAETNGNPVVTPTPPSQYVDTSTYTVCMAF